MQIQWREGRTLRCAEAVRRSAEDSTARAGASRKSRMTANGEWGEAGRRDLFGGKAENDEWCRGTQSFRAVESRFMRQW
jgi:hypothetical protein